MSQSAENDAPFPQNPSEARTCIHGNRVWFGHECGECEESPDGYVWRVIPPARTQESAS